MKDSLVTFIGVDLAWRGEGKNTGIAIARSRPWGADLIAISSNVTCTTGARDFIVDNSTANTVVAIDAPLIIKNKKGQRLCETAIGKKFGRLHASCHSSNLTLYPDAASVRLVEMLKPKFSNALALRDARHRMGKWLLEVYPHPAHVVIFGLEQIIRYKKGRVVDKRAGLRQLQDLLQSLHDASPSLRMSVEMKPVLEANVDLLAGAAMKRYEDSLDAIFCAYLALYVWNWGEARNEMIGDLESGYIVVPCLEDREQLSRKRSAPVRSVRVP